MRLPLAVTDDATAVYPSEWPRKRSVWFHNTSSPSVGIGNGDDMVAPVTPAPYFIRLARVALVLMPSYTYCGYEAERRVGYTSKYSSGKRCSKAAWPSVRRWRCCCTLAALIRNRGLSVAKGSLW